MPFTEMQYVYADEGKIIPAQKWHKTNENLLWKIPCRQMTEICTVVGKNKMCAWL
jgi:hypothetical protein